MLVLDFTKTKAELTEDGNVLLQLGTKDNCLQWVGPTDKVLQGINLLIDKATEFAGTRLLVNTYKLVKVNDEEVRSLLQS